MVFMVVSFDFDKFRKFWWRKNIKSLNFTKVYMAIVSYK